VFVLFAAPPERDLDWSEQGVGGRVPFPGGVYRSWPEGPGRSRRPPFRGTIPKRPGASADDAPDPFQGDGDIEERFQFNTAIAAVMEMVNVLYLVEDAAWKAPGTAGALREAVEILLHMLYPFAPHVAEELWARIGGKGLLCMRPWPRRTRHRPGGAGGGARTGQRQGRGKVTVGAGASEEEVGALAMAVPRVEEHLAGKTIRKTIYVPAKLFSIVAN
jgi:leucyl-tRNA synthetase